jgi:hypothetical protein
MMMQNIPVSPPNKPLQRTPLRVDQDRGYFEGWKRLDGFRDL